jgi:hypothetical protein
MNRKTANTGGTAMRKIGILGLVGVLALILAGCGGGGGDSRQLFFADIESSLSVDGDVALDLQTIPQPAPSVTFAINSGNVLAGVDESPIGTPSVEFRGFLHFPLDIPGNDVPQSAIVQSAVLRLRLNRVQFSSLVPIRIDVVSFTPPIIGSDFYRDVLLPITPTATGVFDIPTASQVVDLDMTRLLNEALAEGVFDFQVRILLDTVPTARGLIEIDENVAPKLLVDFFL